jgi:hypothetical protein
VSKLEWLDTKYVVLWDEMCNRGWLVNGTSALLHLIRAKLFFAERNEFASQLILKVEQIVDATTHQAYSAVQVFLSEENRRLEVYSGKKMKSKEEESRWDGTKFESSTTQKKRQDYFLFEDMVEQYFETLEKLIEHQRKACGQNWINIRPRVRKHLEGWDFVDVANGHDAYPRSAIIHTMGWGWVNFVRSMGALVLFGRGFGDLIQPSEVDRICPEWKTLPSNRYYLAASLYDLQNITRLHGTRWTKPPEIVHGLL